MAFNVSVQNTEFRFSCEPNESVLDAAQRAGLEIPFSCRKGVCGTCKGRIVSGEARAFAGDALSPAERAEGHALFCTSTSSSTTASAAISPWPIRRGRATARNCTSAMFRAAHSQVSCSTA
jgi:ferredoxin